MQAKTFFGFEHILAQEIAALGGANVKVKNRLVEFEGDLGFLYKANYSLRTALRILKPIDHFTIKNEDDLYQKCLRFPWENYMHVNQTFLIDSVVNSTQINHSHYAALRMKDAIADRFRKKFNKRPSIKKYQPDFLFNLHINEKNVNISIDSSGEPLFKRGYRVKAGKAPLNEVMAAGLLRLAGWDGKGNFLDPMCGSGTLPIEAAMVAANIPAQLHRSDFGFMKWKDYDASLFEKIKETRLNRISDFNGKIIGYDTDERALNNAHANIEHADFSDFIELKKQDFFTSEKEISPLLMVFNPPYDERLPINNERFYEQIGDTLKNHYSNTICWILSGDTEAAKKVGLRPSRKIKLYNGKIECRFLQYDIYEGSKKNKD